MMCFRKMLMVILGLPLVIFGEARDVFAAKISNCTDCDEINRVSKNELCDAYKKGGLATFITNNGMNYYNSSKVSNGPL